MEGDSSIAPQPPQKKRRLAPPTFESSFTTSISSPCGSQTKLKSTTKSLSTFMNFKSGFLTSNDDPKGDSSKSVSGLGDSVAESNRRNDEEISRPLKPRLSIKQPHMTTALVDLTTRFEVPLPVLKPKSRIVQPVIGPDDSGVTGSHSRETKTTNVSHLLEGDYTTIRRIETLKVSVPQTPLRILKPPILPVHEKSPASTTETPRSFARPSFLPVPKTPDSVAREGFVSLTSRLTFLQNAIARDSPGKEAQTPERKLVPLLSPLLKNESSEEPKTRNAQVTPAAVPYVHRAETLVGSLRDSKKEEPLTTQFLELTRGIQVSPQKRQKEYGHRFIRSGLAERAENLLTRSDMSFSLWQTSFLKQLCSCKRLKADLRLHIISIQSYTHHPGSSSTFSGLPRSAITICREVITDNYGVTGGSQPQQGMVAFLFSNHETVSSALNFKQGKDVFVWRPWQEVDMPGTDSDDPFVIPSIDACTPPTSQDPGGRRTALLCTRFLVRD